MRSRLRAEISFLLTLAILTLLFCSCTTVSSAQQLQADAATRAQALVDTGEFDQAVAVYDGALEVSTSKELLYNRMLCLAYAGRWDEADLAGIEAAGLYPETLVFDTARLAFFQAREDTAGAVELALQILEKDPYNPETALSLLELYQLTGQTGLAREWARTMVKRGINVQKASDYLLGFYGTDN